jgi:hypothetical protein
MPKNHCQGKLAYGTDNVKCPRLRSKSIQQSYLQVSSTNMYRKLRIGLSRKWISLSRGHENGSYPENMPDQSGVSGINLHNTPFAVYNFTMRSHDPNEI